MELDWVMSKIYGVGDITRLLKWRNMENGTIMYGDSINMANLDWGTINNMDILRS